MDRGVDTVSGEAKTAGLQYVECPHCHYEVMERADGKCIACGKNRFDTAGTTPDLTMLTIDNVHRLPAHCFLCGVETQRLQKFSWTYRINPYAMPPVMIPFILLMSFVPGSQYRQTERLSLPTCPGCSQAAKKVRPLSVSAGLDCRLLVHRIFRQRFETLNGRKKLDWEADTEVDPHAKAEIRILGGVLKLW